MFFYFSFSFSFFEHAKCSIQVDGDRFAIITTPGAKNPINIRLASQGSIVLKESERLILNHGDLIEFGIFSFYICSYLCFHVVVVLFSWVFVIKNIFVIYFSLSPHYYFKRCLETERSAKVCIPCGI